MGTVESQSIEQAQVVDWFHRKWHQIFMRLNKKEIAATVRELAEKHPDHSREKLAKGVVRRSARQSAAVGLATATPALIPGIGTAISIVGILPEEYYIMRKQCELVLEIAAIYEFSLDEYERLYEIITLVGSPSRSIEALMVAKYDIRRMAAKVAVHLGSESGRGALLGLKTASRGAIRRLPALGFFAGGAINYYSLNSLGKKAVRFYALRKNGKKEP